MRNPHELSNEIRIQTTQGKLLVEEAVKMIMDPKTLVHVKIELMKELWDRGWGKPVQPAAVDIRSLSISLTDAQRTERLGELLKKMGLPGLTADLLPGKTNGTA